MRDEKLKKKLKVIGSKTCIMEIENDVQKEEQVNSQDDQIEGLQESDSSIAKHVVRKFDLHLMPWLFGLWFFAALDRANIGTSRESIVCCP